MYFPFEIPRRTPADSSYLLLSLAIADGTRFLIHQGDVSCLKRGTRLFSGFDDARSSADGLARQMGLSLPLGFVVRRAMYMIGVAPIITVYSATFLSPVSLSVLTL